MVWIVRLVGVGAEGEEHGTDIMRIARSDDFADPTTLGLTLAESKRLLAGVQQEIAAAQARVHALRRPECHAIATLFGQVTVRLPRFHTNRHRRWAGRIKNLWILLRK